MSLRSAAIIGINGLRLSIKEMKFFKNSNPLGVILFKRNIKNAQQIISLTNQIKDCLGRDAPILIDQEGGKVARLRHPNFTEYPPAKYFGDIAIENINKAITLVQNNYFSLGYELKKLGINFNCAPILDLYVHSANQVIGNRSFGSNPDIVANLAYEVCKSFKKAGIIPIIKHIPGHGRANIDSHIGLPVISTQTNDYEKDLKPFKKLNNMPVAMTAHIVLKELDDQAVTQSSIIIKNVIRNEIGFNGLLISDDVCMKALKGDVFDISNKARKAGCDIVLHCDGILENSHKAVDGAGFMDKDGINRLNKSFLWLNNADK